MIIEKSAGPGKNVRRPRIRRHNSETQEMRTAAFQQAYVLLYLLQPYE
jgi:hypothetical protein